MEKEQKHSLANDIAEHVKLQQQYDSLYNQSMTILNSLPVAVAVYNAEGKILYFNERFCRIFGTDMEEMAESHPNIYDSPVVTDEIKNAIKAGLPIFTSFPYDFGKVDGYITTVYTGIRHLECNGQPIRNPNGELASYVIIMEDITESLEKEEMLRQSRLKTEIAIKTADIMLWEFDVNSRLFFSDNEPLNGYDKSRPLSIDLYLETIHPEDRKEMVSIMQRMNSGEDFSFTFEGRIKLFGSSEWQYCFVNGSPYSYSESGQVLKYVGTRKNNTDIHKKKQLLDKILNNIPLSIHIKDVEDNFRYIFCNEESKRMFGTSEDTTTYDVMDEEQVARIQKTDLEVFNTGSPYLGLERVNLKDGRSYDTIVRKSVIEDDGKRLLLNTRWDQSLQNELKRRAQILSITLGAMNAFTWFFEPDKNRISFGEGFNEVTKKASEICSVEKFLSCVHPDDKQKFHDSLQAVVEQDNGIWELEYQLDLNGDGVYQWWQTRGMLETSTLNDAPYKYMFGMTICIDAHKQAELTLLKNKEELKKLVTLNELVLNNTNSGLAYITRDYRVQWENVSSCSKSLSFEAYKQGELCYKSAHNRTSPCEECILSRAFQSRQTELIKFKLDNAHVVEVYGTPVFLEDGTADGIVIRVDDVTEREEMIKELQIAKMHAEQSDKLKSAFLANMSHEIRTPLNAIVGFSGLMMYASDEEKEDYMQIINNNNEMLLKLISDILDLSKLEAGSVELKYEEFDLTDYFNSMFASMKQRATNPKIQIVAVNPYQHCLVTLDRNRVAQIITNYVTNAIKYTPEGTIEMGYEYREEGIYFYVKDSGIGIPDEKKNKVFHRFEKLDEFAQGTGLGLSICKAIAEAMGGNVGFESEYGKGSLFWALLPCEVEIPSEITQQRAERVTSSDKKDIVAGTSSSNTPGRKTILVAEDIQSNYQLVSALLRKRFNLVHAANGQEAIEILHKRHIDLLLMDMKMPVMDGLTATAEIRKFNAELPIIALTAHVFENDRLTAMDAGCNEYLVKPIDRAKLMAVLKKYS
jgi:PAS domain S-box-containing protein